MEVCGTNKNMEYINNLERNPTDVYTWIGKCSVINASIINRLFFFFPVSFASKAYFFIMRHHFTVNEKLKES